MTLNIEWLEEESRGYTDEIPDWIFADDGRLSGASHAVKGPKRGSYLARCDVKTAGKVVTLDYRPYEENRKEFYLGVLRLTFIDEKKVGIPKVAWKDEGSKVFEQIEATVIRLPRDESRESISEDEIGSVSKPFDPSNLADARQRVLASLAVRQGQQKFRNALKAAYQSTCALTGCTVVEVLEAAHIIGYRGKETNHVQNGLLLRADIHALFDMGLVGIDPSTWTVVLHPRLQGGPYRELHGSSPRLPQDKAHHPNAKALKQHLKSLGLVSKT